MIGPFIARLTAMVQGRSAQWPAVEKAHRQREPLCQVCGTTKNIEVHHLKPFHFFPQLELDEWNLISLCREHHLWWGHLGSWLSWNENCRQDAAIWREKIADRPIGFEER